MWSISNQTRIPTNRDIQLTSSGHSQFLSHLLIFLRKQGGTPGWKGHYPPAFLAWQGGMGWVWNGVAGWGKSRGGTSVGFGPFGLCWCFFFSFLSPLSLDLTRHSSWLCSEHVLQGKTRQNISWETIEGELPEPSPGPEGSECLEWKIAWHTQHKARKTFASWGKSPACGKM